MNNLIRYMGIVALLAVLVSCQKYLDQKPDKSLVVPSSLGDLQAVLDNNNDINQFQNNGMGEASADNYYLTDVDYDALSALSARSVYIWDKELFYDNPAYNNEWSAFYAMVYKANLVLENIGHMERTAQHAVSWDNIKGSAYFLRGYGFSLLARNFAKAYDSVTAKDDLGIPLRLSADFNDKSVRANNEATYQQIVRDLKASIPLLPNKPQQVMRPSKQAAYALLARVLLSMQAYDQAALYADSSLQIGNDLMDYASDASIDRNASFPFARFNKEVVFHSEGLTSPLYSGWAKVDSLLYNTYEEGDQRKTLFFLAQTEGQAFVGNYTADASIFNGIAVDEMYLTLAESLVRVGETAKGLGYLNQLLEKRWTPGQFVPITATVQTAALEKVLLERRKELLMRDLRWMDIKRLNKAGVGITISRKLKGELLQLVPNDNRFALPLPQKVIELSGMPQNPR